MSRLSAAAFLCALFASGCVAGAEPDEELAEDADLDEPTGAVVDELAADEGARRAEQESDALPSYCNDVLTWNSSYTTFENRVLTLVNQRRAAGAVCGGTPYPAATALALNENLRCAARKHSKDMGTNNFMSHTGSNGSSPWTRMKNAGYNYKNAAENIAAGQSTPETVVNGWMASPDHCKNIMNGALRDLGVGYHNASTSTYKHYWTQAFGSR
ncbi:CAP domain-containing protein [Chondromyces crocatus]|nr:CAP domain-containing protein [Chondromyces crocatus]